MFKKLAILQGPEGDTSGGGATTTSSTPAPAAPAPAPASAPSTAASAASSVSNEGSAGNDSPSDAFDFGALVDHHDNGTDLEVETPVAAPAAAPAQAATTAPAPAPAAPAPAPVPAVAPTEPVVQPAQATGQPAASTEQPVQPAFDPEKHRTEFLGKLLPLYKLSDQEVQDIQTNPGEAFPKLAAQLHYNVSMAMNAALQQLMPQAIASQLRMQTLKQSYETKFYDKWPALKAAVAKDPKTEEAINQSFEAFRATNPKATIDDLINKAGLLACISLGLNPLEGQQSPPPVGAPQVVQPPPVIPGRPAGTGAQGHVPVQQHGSAPQSDADLFSGIVDHWNKGGG